MRFQTPLPKIQSMDGFLGLLSICSLLCRHFWRAMMIYVWKQAGTWKEKHPSSKLSFSHPSDRRIKQKKQTCLPIISLELYRDWYSFYRGENQKEDRPGHYIWDVAALSERVQQRKPYIWLSPHMSRAHCRGTRPCTESTLSAVGQVCKKSNFSLSLLYYLSITVST